MADPWAQRRNAAIQMQRLQMAREAQARQQFMAQQSLQARHAADARAQEQLRLQQQQYQRGLDNDQRGAANDQFRNEMAWRQYKLAEQRRKDQILEHSRTQADKTQQRQEERRMKPIPEAERKKLLENAQIYESLLGLTKSQKPSFFGSIVEPAGAIQNWASERLPGIDPAMSNWWRDYQRTVRIPQRFAVTGATMTPREIAEWQHGDIGYTTKPEEAVSTLNRRIALMHRAIGRQARSLSTTYDPAQVKEALGMDIPPEVPQGARYPSLDEMTQEGARLSGVGRPPLEQILGR